MGVLMMELNESKLKVFSYGLLQDMVTLWKLMDRENITREEVETFVASVNKNAQLSLKLKNVTKEQAEKITALQQKCPECGSKLNLIPITAENETGNRSVWRCSKCKGCSKKYTKTEKECTYERFDKRELKEIVDDYNNQVEQILLGE